MPDPSADLQAAMEKRKQWFFECQLRHLAFDQLRGITAESQDPLLDLISIRQAVSPPLGQRGTTTGRVYLDDQQPVWSSDEKLRREPLKKGLIGDMGNWLGFKNPRRLAEAVADLKAKYEQSRFASVIDIDPALVKFRRRQPADDDTGADDGTGQATSRAAVAAAKPWLIPELYNEPHEDTRELPSWLENLERFISDYESELQAVTGGNAGTPLSLDTNDTTLYRALINSLMGAMSVHDAGDAVKVTFLDQIQQKDKNANGKPFKYSYAISIDASGLSLKHASDYPVGTRVRYWNKVCADSLREVYLSNSNSDMGLCQLVRLLYLFGTLPASLGADEELTWRTRQAPGTEFDEFFALRESKLPDDPDLARRFRTAKAKLRVILEESAAHPRSAAPTFSLLFEEALRQGIRSFKFWMDEPLRAKNEPKAGLFSKIALELAAGPIVGTYLASEKDSKGPTDEQRTWNRNKAINEARSDTGKGSPEEEMEYWSENHYIMFASSEYLIGQLWERDEFQPGKEFLESGSKSGILSGSRRKERGRARVLKWLNNRLQFGWTEFNSSGYYREHLWSLLNLADFALDAEVREKATLVIDLLLFDVIRFQHRGAMGAPGGRSQFESRSSGWDNRLGDVVEIMLGTRGLFLDADGQIGSMFATSRYRVPDVLLQIGVFPPSSPFVDRSRVSITFEEAPRHGIGYSMDSEQKDSVREGYAEKVKRYSPFVDAVNQEIARTHEAYGQAEDDAVFWLTMSAFFLKQTVRDHLALREKFGLEETGVFKTLPGLIRIIAGLLKASHGAIGAAIGGLFGGAPYAVIGGALGFFEDDIFAVRLLEKAADDFAVLLEGSARTRANIVAYRTPDVMLASLQNFRPGQLNFQSCSHQAILNASVGVFTSAPFAGLDLSNLEVGGAAGLLGLGLGALTVGPVLAPLFGAGAAILGVVENENQLQGTNPFASSAAAGNEDGPGWWTGSWALPMVVQSGSAAIIAYDYSSIQNFLANDGSHAWFPKSGFDRVVERRTSAYHDANFFLFDITDIGPKGFWAFGKIVHPAASGDPGEAYVGVFSNQRPRWLDQDSDFYKEQIQEIARKPINNIQNNIVSLLDKLQDALDSEASYSSVGTIKASAIKSAVDRAVDKALRPDIKQEDWVKGATDNLVNWPYDPDLTFKLALIANMEKAIDLAKLEISLRISRRIWPDPLPQDYFADRDWYVDGKNIWIIQVGSKAEFGDFEQFIDRVSSARIELDDAGDMECSYDIPKPDGSSDRLTLVYGDGGRFRLNDSVLQTDLFPRFENPFLRGGRVEWGQREYVIEYSGKSLLHDFSNFDHAVRQEQVSSTAEERNLVKALVIFLRTGNEDMDAFTVARADVSIGCAQVAKDQVVAAGPVSEDTNHDAEWIFFDFPVTRDPDMALSLTHPASSKGDAAPHWKMSFILFALTGDRILRPCSLSHPSFEFKDDRRTSPRFPFSIPLSEWRPWDRIRDDKSPAFWMISQRPDYTQAYYDYIDLLAIGQDERLWHKRLMPCAAAEAGWFAVTQAKGVGADEPNLAEAFFAAAVSWQPGTLLLAVQSLGTLFASRPSPSGAWTEGWKQFDVWTYPDGFLGIPNTSGTPIPVSLSAFSPVAGIPSTAASGGVELSVLGADGNFYSRTTWQSGDKGPWRKIDVTGFTPLFGVEFAVTGDFLLVLAGDRSLWAAVVDHSVNHLAPTWEKVTSGDFAVSRFTAISFENGCRVMATTTSGGVRATTYRPGSSAAWFAIDLPGVAAAPGSPLASASPASGQARFFAVGTDSKVYSIDWDFSVDWPVGMAWSEVAPGGSGIAARTTGGTIAAVSRVSGQVEIFAQSTGGSLNKAWWS